MSSFAESSADSHEHPQGACPVTGKTYDFCPRQAGDVRSPCPALNALANHGYLPRDGKNIGVWDLVRGLKNGYQLSTVLACLLSFGAMLLLGQYRCLSLSDLARHNMIEHNASLVHRDDNNGAEYAPTKVDRKLLAALCAEGGKLLPNRITLEDAAHIRVKREAQCGKLDGVHAEIARGEIVIAIGVLGGKDALKNGVNISALHEWMQHERLPTGWRPDHTQGLYQTYKMAKYVRERMREIGAQQPPNKPGEY
ncbi:Chloroperoxidase [Suillus subalutaceus]|uniref:Chloroperoxidase n=1 Tax=Suillus subalutaceus TaxID=48586 RepID=UPI001B8771B8|nr:Chloroperoxidase [Suillus subalutaceus]KAG1836242.1 Chloroperoxidase [Suillus subalutaceus]